MPLFVLNFKPFNFMWMCHEGIKMDWWPLFASVFVSGCLPFLPLFVLTYTHSAQWFWISRSYLTSACLLEILLISLSAQAARFSNLGIFTLQVPAQCGEYAGINNQGVTNTIYFTLPIFFLCSLVENPALGLQGTPVSHLDQRCTVKLKVNKTCNFRNNQME